MLGLIIYFIVFTLVLDRFVVWLGWLASGSPGGALPAYGDAAAELRAADRHAGHPPRPRPADPDQRRHWCCSSTGSARAGCTRCSRASAGGTAGLPAGAALVVLRRGRGWCRSIGQPWVFAPSGSSGWYLLVDPAHLAAAGRGRGVLLPRLPAPGASTRRRRTAPGSGWSARRRSSPCSTARRTLPAFLYRVRVRHPGRLCWWSRPAGWRPGSPSHVVNNLVTFGYAALSGTVVATYAITGDRLGGPGLEPRRIRCFRASRRSGSHGGCSSRRPRRELRFGGPAEV